MRRISKREIFLIGFVLVLLISSPWFPYLSSQHRNLKKVREHIATIQPEWSVFLPDNPGCRLVELFPYTGKDGLLGLSGEVASTNDFDALKGFIEQTDPPRPIHMLVKVINHDLETYGILVEARQAEQFD